ncbi:MAG: hypothetical protein ACJAWO_002348 [Halieaceae bacterium]
MVHIDGLGQDAVIRVYDMNGRIAMEVEKGTNVFSIAALDSGVYYLTIEYTQGFNRIQIVKQ